MCLTMNNKLCGFFFKLLMTLLQGQSKQVLQLQSDTICKVKSFLYTVVEQLLLTQTEAVLR